MYRDIVNHEFTRIYTDLYGRFGQDIQDLQRLFGFRRFISLSRANQLNACLIQPSSFVRRSGSLTVRPYDRTTV